MAIITTRKGDEIIVDDDLAPTISQISWYVNTNGYAVNRNNHTYLRLHRYVMELNGTDVPSGMDVDHINNDRLDNRFENLRLATRSQNLANTPGRYHNQHGFRGVQKHNNKFRGVVWKKGRQYNTTVFDTPEEAAEARDALALEVHGEFAALNT